MFVNYFQDTLERTRLVGPMTAGSPRQGGQGLRAPNGTAPWHLQQPFSVGSPSGHRTGGMGDASEQGHLPEASGRRRPYSGNQHRASHSWHSQDIVLGVPATCWTPGRSQYQRRLIHTRRFSICSESGMGTGILQHSLGAACP